MQLINVDILNQWIENIERANRRRLIIGLKPKALKVADVRYMVNKIPCVDAVEVVHGRWEEDKVEAGDPYDGNSVYCFDIMRCSVCGECFDVSVAYNYCPNCGADMRERSEGE